MLMEEARNKIVEFGKRMSADGLAPGTAGNISIYDPETGYMAISPSGVPYDKTLPEDVVILDLDGNVIDGDKKPSSEHGLHAVFYRTDPEARAVVHNHSMYCTILACMGEPLRSVHYALAEAQCSEIPLVPYHTFGTPELADAAAEALKKKGHGLILQNHGMCAYGPTIESAYGLALTMEWCAQVQWHCMAAGKMNVLSDEQMEVAMEHYKTYGQKKSDGSHTGGYSVV